MIDKSPDAFRTISEAAEHLDLPQHVLRFWETRFPQIKPLKRGGGRRYYRPDDVEFLRGLKHLLHAERYTIKGVQKIIKEQGQKAVQFAGKDDAVTPQGSGNQGIDQVVPLKTSSAVKPPMAPKPAVAVQPLSGLNMPKQAVSMPSTMRGKLEAALVELLECRRIIANLNPT
jgi:DNA-binding transcriptional MerR regulator